MKLIDPIGGLKLFSYNWVINLTLILTYIFYLSCYDDDILYEVELKEGHVKLCYQMQALHVIIFSLQIVEEFVIDKYFTVAVLRML